MMKTRRSRIAPVLSFVVAALVLSSAASAYVLLSPARRWFPSNTPRVVTVDNRGLTSVTSPDPDRGVTAAVGAVEAWNSGGVNVTNAGSGSVAYQLGDG